MRVMHCESQCCVVVSIILYDKVTALYMTIIYTNAEMHGGRFKRANMDNFNVLIDLYKLNPLMKSNFYKSFTHQAMLPNRARAPSAVLNLESNESTKEKQEKINLHLKRIEEKIHASNTSRNVYKQPDYNIDNMNVEKFTVDVIVNDQKNNREFERKEEGNGFNDILGHIESNEIYGELSVTKNISAQNEQKFVEKLPLQKINSDIHSNNVHNRSDVAANGYIKDQRNNSVYENNVRNTNQYTISKYSNDEVVVFK